MKHSYEMFLSAHEDWDQSSIMYNVRRRSGKRKCGKYVWKTLKALKEEQLDCTTCAGIGHVLSSPNF